MSDDGDDGVDDDEDRDDDRAWYILAVIGQTIMIPTMAILIAMIMAR